jgi:adenylosuccinate synthase
MCITKLDVLDGLETIRICTGYRINGKHYDIPPVGAAAISQCEPVYEDHQGWKESTLGIKVFDELPGKARAYLKRMEELTATGIDIVSTGPDRAETIVLKHPFD